MEKVTSFITAARDLDVYKRAYVLSLEIHKASLEFPKIEQFALADQMRRASKSICANLAEGFAKQTHSKPEFGRFLSIALGSCSEMQTWIIYAFDLAYIEQSQLNHWLTEYDAIFAMLVKFREKLK
jgi:four helix bundle protein